MGQEQRKAARGGAKGLQPGRTHSEQLGLTKKNHENKAGSLAWRERGKVGCRTRVRTRHKVAANGSEAGQIGLARRG